MIAELMNMLLGKVELQFKVRDEMNFAVDMGGYMIPMDKPRVVGKYIVFSADARKIIDPLGMGEKSAIFLEE